jgi:hypothetical protein
MDPKLQQAKLASLGGLIDIMDKKMLGKAKPKNMPAAPAAQLPQPQPAAPVADPIPSTPELSPEEAKQLMEMYSTDDFTQAVDSAPINGSN